MIDLSNNDSCERNVIPKCNSVLEVPYDKNNHKIIKKKVAYSAAYAIHNSDSAEGDNLSID